MKTLSRSTYLLSRIIRVLTSLTIVTSSMEWYGFTSFAIGVVHLVAFIYFDVMHLDRTPFFAAHNDFRTDYLSWRRDIPW